MGVEDTDNSDDDTSPPRSTTINNNRRSSLRRRAHLRSQLNSRDNGDDKSCQEGNDEDEDDKDADSDEYEEEEKPQERPKRGKKRSAQSSTKEETVSRKTKKQQQTKLVCPHCSRNFAVKKGLEYHIKNYVCRPAEKPASFDNEEAPAVKKAYKRLRGKLEDRTCPKCNRVFTSVLGMNYHREKNVCDKKESKEVPFPILQQGSKFVTQFGVVEVVRDDRATPTASFPDNIKTLTRQYNTFKSKQDAHEQKCHRSSTVRHLAQRKRLSKFFEEDRLNKSSYSFEFFHPTSYDNRPDPGVPKESFPDRIVECILVADQRARFHGLVSQIDAAYELPKHKTPLRLFLRRRVLTKVYSEQGEILICPRCGKRFDSRPGYSHHERNTSCVEKSQEAKLKKEALLSSIDTSAQRYLEKARIRPKKEEAARPLENPAPPDTKATPAKVKSENPEKEISAPVPSADTTRLKNETTKGDNKFVDPRITYLELEEELTLLQSRMLGPIYPSVFKCLKFKKATIPKRAKKKKRKQPPIIIKRVVKKKKARSTPTAKAVTAQNPQLPMSGALPLSSRGSTLAQTGSLKIGQTQSSSAAPNATLSNSSLVPTASGNQVAPAAAPSLTDTQFSQLPPIIDVRVLLAEVQTGRYPRMKLRKGKVAHDTKCRICKGFPQRLKLIPCSFCENSFHFKCLLTKFTVKAPEPSDAIMCHNCIQYVMARRARAEKRRLLKNNEEAPRLDPDAAKKTKGLVEGNEYECVAAQGRQAADLIELLRHTKGRFQQAIHASKANAARRAAIEQLLKQTDMGLTGNTK